MILDTSMRLARRKGSGRVAALLAALLLVAELLALTHPLDAAAHANDEPCKICVGLAAFGGAAPATEAPQLAPAAGEQPAAEAPSLPVGTRPRAPAARGPPSAS